MKNFKIVSFILLSAAFFIVGCKKEFRNPNNPTAPDILETREGLITLSIGMKQNYATSAIEGLYINSGVTSRELRGTSTLQNVLDLEAGADVLPTNNGNIAQVWNRMFRVMGMADNVILNAPKVIPQDQQMLSGILAHAHIFKEIGRASCRERV